MRIPTILASVCLLLISCQQEEEGCTDPTANNYDVNATNDDGSCIITGCTNPEYVEYDPLANTDDGSCICLTIDPDCVSPTMDEYSYEVITIGCQCWFAENLRTTVYTNGSLIPSSLSSEEWALTNQGATAIYGEGASDCSSNSPNIDACDEAQSLAEYGRLYNWYAVGDVRGLCPSGWHVPTEEEWQALEDYITSQGFALTEGTTLKATTGWSEDRAGTDDFGFFGLPGGNRDINFDSGFYGAGNFGYWWSSSTAPADYGYWVRRLTESQLLGRSGRNPRYGLSVRCIKD